MSLFGQILAPAWWVENIFENRPPARGRTAAHGGNNSSHGKHLPWLRASPSSSGAPVKGNGPARSGGHGSLAGPGGPKAPPPWQGLLHSIGATPTSKASSTVSAASVRLSLEQQAR